MKTLDDYKGSDCALFRMPPINFEVVRVELERIMLDTWRQEGSADSAVNSILHNTRIIAALKSQIEDNVRFQKEQALESLETKTSGKLEEYENGIKDGLGKINETIGTEVKYNEERLNALNQEGREKLANYNAAQARLEEMRSRIKSKLKDLGGKEQLENILTIHQSVVLEKPPDAQEETASLDLTVLDETKKIKQAESLKDLDKTKKAKSTILQKFLYFITLGYYKK
ncbi:hypothetical protein HYX19_01470 [Candidatus Woesearchaeota archaeon]|nr:hypothetical protein [Candidatus Woesearchaeota archaeon]